MIGASSEEAFSSISKYFPMDTAEKVHRLLSEPSEVMGKAFKPFSCFDCANCSYSENSCAYTEVDKLIGLVMEALSKSTVSQEALLKYLKENYYGTEQELVR